MLSTGKWASAAWLMALRKIMDDGDDVKPRGMPTLEVQSNKVLVLMKYPVVLCPARKLSYRFLAGEALWILSGSDRVQDIAPYNANIAQFSDDGETFFGAYGPKVVGQLDYVVKTLLADVDTRQAVISIWRERPPKTKDVPCTLSMAFMIRNGQLHLHVFMRSSDAWLGLPYDMFNFSMIALRVACAYNDHVVNKAVAGSPVKLGCLHLTTASGHTYERDWEGIEACIREDTAPTGEPIPAGPLLAGNWNFFEHSLVVCRDKIDDPSMWRIRP